MHDGYIHEWVLLTPFPTRNAYVVLPQGLLQHHNLWCKCQIHPPQCHNSNFSGGGQHVALPIPQRSNTLGLRLFAQANQTPSIDEGTEINFNAHFPSQILPLLSRTDPIGGDLVQINHNVSSSPTQSTSEVLNLNLTL
jgi:hypothetical protein